MVQINMGEREITVKVVYYGPALSGKTTNLLQLHELIASEARGKMVTLDTADDRTLYFDFLPIQFGTQSGFSIKIKLFTVPGQVMHKSTRKVVLSGADAVAFIADSQRSSASANAYSWRDMEANLKSNGIDFEHIPKVVQFNKRDLSDVKPLSDIKKSWGDMHFQGYLTIKRVLPGVIHDAHPSASDLPAKRVIPQCLKLHDGWRLACSDKVFEARE